MITPQEYNHLQENFKAQAEWVKDLSYAILSLQTGDGQQFNLSSDYYDGGEFVDDIYVQALLRGQVLEPEDLTDGKIYMSDLHIKEYRYMEQNNEVYTKFLWNLDLFKGNFSLWSWIVWDMDYQEYQKESL